jgi:hypothetical protein
MLAEIFLLVITFYLLYRFVFNFLLPIFKTTRHVRQQFRNMQDAAGAQQQYGSQQNGSQQGSQTQQPKNWQERHSRTKGPAEDYIEFEEIKAAKENRR